MSADTSALKFSEAFGLQIDPLAREDAYREKFWSAEHDPSREKYLNIALYMNRPPDVGMRAY